MVFEFCELKNGLNSTELVGNSNQKQISYEQNLKSKKLEQSKRFGTLLTALKSKFEGLKSML